MCISNLHTAEVEESRNPVCSNNAQLGEPYIINDKGVNIFMRYKNTSVTEKTFFGIKIAPGETKDFPSYVNDSRMLLVDNAPIRKPNQVKSTPSIDSKPAAKPAAPKIVKEETPNGPDSNK